MSHSTTRRNRHSYMARPTRRTKQPILIPVAGNERRPRLEYHVAFSSGGSFRVSEIWDSKEQFEAFGQRLMPILTESGVELAGPPEVVEIHNIIKR